MRRVPGGDDDAIPGGDIWFRVEQRGLDLAGHDVPAAGDHEVAAVDLDGRPMREDLHGSLAGIDFERDVGRHDDCVARHNVRIHIVGRADRQVVRAAGPVGTAGGGPRRGVRVTRVGRDVPAKDGGWQDTVGQHVRGRLNPIDTAGCQQHGSDADAQPVFPGVAQEKTGGRNRLKPVHDV